MLTVQYARAVPEVKFNAVEPGYSATELGGVKNEHGRPVEISARNIVRRPHNAKRPAGHRFRISQAAGRAID